MDQQRSETEVSGNHLWEWIPVNEFRLPVATIQTTFKTRMMSLVERYRKPPLEKQDAMLIREKLESLSQDILNRIVPPIDLKYFVQSLDPVLGPWCESRSTKFVAVLDIPYSWSTEILRYWAKEKGFRVIEPPAPADLLKASPEDGDAWFDQFKGGDCWVLPELERCWLRHEAGLARIRRFFDLLVTGGLGFGVLGCGSWAWAFFRHALGISAPVLFVMKPFDSVKLAQWFGKMAFEKSRRRIWFRQSDNGRYILSSFLQDTEKKNNVPGQEPFLKDLAAFSYGIPGVAYAYWHTSLQTEPDTLGLEKNQDETDGKDLTVWVKPWMSIDSPGLPENMKRSHALIMHSLLLHESLDMDTLSKLLSMRRHYFGQALYELSDKGLIESLDDQWRVTPKGYPVVRGFLKSEGFLTDDVS